MPAENNLSISVDEDIATAYENMSPQDQDRVRENLQAFVRSEKKVLVAEGDSWFNLPFGKTDVIDELRKWYDIRNFANHGHTIRSMANEEKQLQEFRDAVCQLLIKKNPPCAILISGGGNDIPDNLCEMLEDNPGQNQVQMNKNKVKQVISELRANYVALLSKIDLWSNICNAESKIPVLIHGYAYSVPDGTEFDLFGDLLNMINVKRGPWLKPKFDKKNYCDLEQNTETMTKLIDLFNNMLIGLADAKSLFHHIDVQHVDLRRCLSNNVENDKYREDWSDELHPSEKGFECIAKKFHRVIEDLSSIQVSADQNV